MCVCVCVCVLEVLHFVLALYYIVLITTYLVLSEGRCSQNFTLLLQLSLINRFLHLWSPWYNCTGWLGVKHQLTYLLTPSPLSCTIAKYGQDWEYNPISDWQLNPISDWKHDLTSDWGFSRIHALKDHQNSQKLKTTLNTKQKGSKIGLLSSWISTSCQLHRVTPGQIMCSKFFHTISKHKSLN